MEDLISFIKSISNEIAIAIVVLIITLFAEKIWIRLKSIFDAESRRQGEQIEGNWTLIEVFDDNTSDVFNMNLTCKLGKVKGLNTCREGFDKGKEYIFEGTYKDKILTFHWSPKKTSSVESGTITLQLLKDGKLYGRGLYVEPENSVIYPSTVSGSRVGS